MFIVRHPANLAPLLSQLRAGSNSLAFVPTMGALHAGHISLIEQAKMEANLVVASIFVNPTQFNDPADFQKYPITLGSDIQQLAKAGCHLLFLPDVAGIYPEGLISNKIYEIGRLEALLEGAHRPGHFQGVCQVVDRLLNLVQPDQLFLGQKDYQQCLVLKQLLRQRPDSIKLRIVPTCRETDGLAMSSRNRRLSPEGRLTAAMLYATLQTMAERWPIDPPQQIMNQALDQLQSAGFQPDYCVIAHPETLETIHEYNNNLNPVFLVAATLEGVRLIDNLSRQAN